MRAKQRNAGKRESVPSRRRPHADITSSGGNLHLTTERQGVPIAVAGMKSEVAGYLADAYAEASKGKALTAIKNYLLWCKLANLYPHEAGPPGITDYELGMYVAWMARTLSHYTIIKYISMGVRLVHEAAGIKWIPPNERFVSRLVLRGIKRAQGGDQPPKRKLPVTIHLLRGISKGLPVVTSATVDELSYWAACLVLFFCCLRKAHATVVREPNLQTLRRSDVLVRGTRLVIQIRHTKTRQYNSAYGAGELQYLLPEIPDSDLCPTKALAQYMRLTTGLPPQYPLFVETRGKKDAQVATVQPLTYNNFLNKFKASITRVGLDPAYYAGQSFRRGGATFAREAGVPDEVIRAMGDWKSDAWQAYVSATAVLRERAAFSLAKAVEEAMAADGPILS